MGPGPGIAGAAIPKHGGGQTWYHLGHGDRSSQVSKAYWRWRSQSTGGVCNTEAVLRTVECECPDKVK